MKVISKNIVELIPQRPPFLLIDELVSIENEIVTCSFTVPQKHVLVDDGKLNEAGLVENIAQTAAAGNGYAAKENGTNIPDGFIAGIRNLKINYLPSADKKLITKVFQLDRIMDFNLIRGEILENENLVASCEMKIYCP
jgi:predicted hotdog family 3-hydroxylacyl-ACP dehydratase